MKNFLLSIFIFFYYSVNTAKIIDNIKKLYYDSLFNALEFDDYNLSLIYHNNYNTIKIKHISNKNITDKEVCIFGVLCNEIGFKIEKSMIDWLLPEYDVYCIYQKYPGLLYEYPALRFAQWFSLFYNITVLLYVHTKGAFYNTPIQNSIRKLWKHEFTDNRKKIYISLLKNNISDISLPFRQGACTWYNGMFISNRAFTLINEIKLNQTDRWYYEELFKFSNQSCNNIRFKGILNDNVSSLIVGEEVISNVKNFNNDMIKKQHLFLESLNIFVLLISLFLKKIKLKQNKNVQKCFSFQLFKII